MVVQWANCPQLACITLLTMLLKSLHNALYHSAASDVANFDGSSSLVYRRSARPSWKAMEVVSLKFKTHKNSGTLLHAEGKRDDSLTLVLEKGRLLLYHQQGIKVILSMYYIHSHISWVWIMNYSQIQNITNEIILKCTVIKWVHDWNQQLMYLIYLYMNLYLSLFVATVDHKVDAVPFLVDQCTAFVWFHIDFMSLVKGWWNFGYWNWSEVFFKL